MRQILHIIESWGPGGAETVFADLASGLNPARFASHVMLSRGRDWLYEEVRRRGIAPVVNPSSSGFDLRYLARLAGAVRRLGVDLIQAHTFGTGVYASAAGLICRVPVVCTFHGRLDLGRDARLRSIKYRTLARGASRIVCVSGALRSDVLAALPLRPAQVSIIHNGVDASRFRPGEDGALRASLGAQPDELLVGAVGNVRRAKGYEILLEAAAEVVRRGVPVRFVVVGQATGPEFQELERRHSELGLGDRVRFLGFRDDVDALYRAFDVYLITSHSEGFSLSTVQALATGLPVVATRSGGPEEIIADGRTGILAELGSATQIADAIESLARDRDLRRRLGDAGRASAVERFSIQAMVREYEALYDQLLAG